MPDKLNFLIPLDFNPESEAALEYASGIGEKLNAGLHLVHIIEDESPLYRLVMKENQRDMIRRGAYEKLDELAGRTAGPAGLTCSITVYQGKIYDRIIEASQSSKADMIFMGRTESSDMKKNFTGTNTMHIIKEAEVPVVTLRKNPSEPGCSHIMLPIDLTKQSIVQASNAITAAKMMNAKITVVSLLSDDRKSIEIKFIQRLEEIRKVFEKLEIPCDVKLIQPDKKEPVKNLNELAAELKADLLMIMTQQEMNITEYFIGSLAQQIINGSDIPVMSINPLSGEKAGIPDPLSEVFINPIQILDR
jgi:nucleotide-binding universal stress UspA family protein